MTRSEWCVALAVVAGALVVIHAIRTYADRKRRNEQ